MTSPAPTQHEQIVAAYETYIAENEKFTQKGVKAAAARARKALQEMSCKIRRLLCLTQK